MASRWSLLGTALQGEERPGAKEQTGNREGGRNQRGQRDDRQGYGTLADPGRGAWQERPVLLGWRGQGLPWVMGTFRRGARAPVGPARTLPQYLWGDVRIEPKDAQLL